MAWWMVGVWIASLALSALLAPEPEKPADAVPATVKDFDIPTTAEGTSLRVLFGKAKVKGPVVAWWGDLKAIPIKQKIDSGKK
jgi:hypothetical protein